MGGTSLLYMTYCKVLADIHQEDLIQWEGQVWAQVHLFHEMLWSLGLHREVQTEVCPLLSTRQSVGPLSVLGQETEFISLVSKIHTWHNADTLQ